MDIDTALVHLGTLDEAYKAIKSMSDEVDAIDLVTTIYHVDGNRIDTYTEEGSRGYPFKTIQAAIDAASSPALVKIAPGSYNEQLTLKSGVCLWAKRNTVNLTFAGGDTITRPNGVGSLWVYGLQVGVTGDGGHAAYKDVGASGSIHLRFCYFSAYAATDFAILGIASNNCWMESCDSEGVVKFSAGVSCSMTESQVIAQANHAGVPGLHLLNCLGFIYQRSAITQNHADAGSNALEIDGGGGNQIAIASLTSANRIALYVTGNSLNNVIGLVGMVGGVSDVTVDAGSSVYWGVNNYSPLKATFNGTKNLMTLHSDIIITANDHHSQQHGLGGGDHATATLAQLNAKVSDKDLIAADDARIPTGDAGDTDGAAVLAESLADTEIPWANLDGKLTGDATKLNWDGALNVGGDILPLTTDIYDLGTTLLRFGALWLTGASIHLGEAEVTETNYGDLIEKKHTQLHGFASEFDHVGLLEVDEGMIMVTNLSGLPEVVEDKHINNVPTGAIGQIEGAAICEAVIPNGAIVIGRGGEPVARIGHFGDQLFWDELNGFLGVGTALPQEVLHVAGTIRSDDLAGIGDRNVGADSDGNLIILGWPE